MRFNLIKSSVEVCKKQMKYFFMLKMRICFVDLRAKISDLNGFFCFIQILLLNYETNTIISALKEIFVPNFLS